MDPLPVSRFNLVAAIKQAQTSGQRLVELAGSGPKAFRSLGERVAYHMSLPYMGYEHVDEIALWGVGCSRHRTRKELKQRRGQ